MPQVFDGARMVVMTGQLSGSVVPVGEKLTVGRHSENALRLQDAQTSRFHAVIERTIKGYVLADLGSRTGTLVNGERISGPVLLGDQTEVKIGQTLLQFNVKDPAARASTRNTGSLAFKGTVEIPAPPFPLARAPSPKLSISPVPPTSSATKDDLHLTLLPMHSAPPVMNFERKTDAELRRTGEHLQALLTANSIISSELDIDKLFEKVLDQIFVVIPYHRAVIMTQEPGSTELVPRATRVAKAGTEEGGPHVSKTIVNRAFNERVGVLTLDAGSDARFDSRRSIVDHNIRSALCVPMMHHDSPLGVIYLDTVGVRHTFRNEDLLLLTGIAGPAGVAVRTAMLLANMRKTAVDTVFRLAIAAEYRDDDTGFHIHRMSDYAEALAQGFGMDADFCETLKLASPMHDVGKIGIPDAILKKPGKLTPEEFEEMKQHTVKGGAILGNSDSDLLRMAETIALSHHEKFDGSGYPRGRAGSDIPIEGRIVAVADVFDALTTARCYKKAFPLEEAYDILRKGARFHFDPEIIDVFFAVNDRILTIREHYRALEIAAQQKAFIAQASNLAEARTLT